MESTTDSLPINQRVAVGTSGSRFELLDAVIVHGSTGVWRTRALCAAHMHASSEKGFEELLRKKRSRMPRALSRVVSCPRCRRT
jgi:hypothetical protein